MASRTLAIKYTTEGYQQAIQSMRGVGLAFDEALQNAQNAVQEAAKAAQEAATSGDANKLADAQKAQEAAAKRVKTAVSNAYRELRVKSTKEIEDLKAQAISAFKALEASGVASTQDLANAQAALTKRLADLDKQLDQTGQGMADLGQQTNLTTGFFANFLANLATGAVQNFLGTITNGVNSLKSAVFAAGIATENIKAQLKTIEGSAEAANAAYEKIAKFAKETPFELEQVTQAYVSLANRGIKPTEAELRKIGDLAGSQQKQLGQYVEAILDATSGENERLKEFGIQAEKSGSKVSFTFRGITKTVEASQQAIFQALLSFSELQGVFGGMEERAKTTEGQLSNLTDSLKAIYVLLFDAIKPALDALIASATGILDPLGQQKDLFASIKTEAEAFKGFLEGNPQIAKALADQLKNGVQVAAKAVATTAKQILEFLQENPTAIEETIKNLRVLVSVMGEFVKLINTALEGWRAIGDVVRVIGQEIGAGQVTKPILDAGGTQEDVNRVSGEIRQEINKAPFLDRFDPNKVAAITQAVVRQEVERLQQKNVVAESKKATSGQVVGYVGNTGGSTGPHLDVRGKTATGERLSQSRLDELLQMIYVNGKSLAEQKGTITSGYGERIHPISGTRKMHPAYDFGFAQGTPIEFRGQAKGFNQVPAAKGGAAGNYLEITLPTGEIIQLLHLDKFANAVDKTTATLGKTSATAAKATAELSPNFARLTELDSTLQKTKQFEDVTARMVALIIAAGEAGPQYLKQGTNADLFSFRGGAGNNMQGFAQFNQKYFSAQTASSESYSNLLGAMLTGQVNLPSGKGKFNPRELEKAIQDGVVQTEKQLLDYLQKQIPIVDWHGLHESGGGGKRIRESGILGYALSQIKGQPTDFAARSKEESSVIEEARKRQDDQTRQRQDAERQGLDARQKRELLNFDLATAKLPPAERDERETQRTEITRQQALRRETLQIDQTLNQLLEERSRKEADLKAGRETTSRDISAEITLLREKKQQLSENFGIETQIISANQAHRTAAEALARANERRRQEQGLEQQRLEQQQAIALNEFDAATAQLPEGGERDARAFQRQALEARLEATRETLQLEQAISNLQLEREQKLSGELTTGRDITAEIQLLEQRKQQLEQTRQLEEQIAASDLTTAIEEKTTAYQEQVEELDILLESARLNLDQTDLEGQALAEIEERYSDYGEAIDSAREALLDLIEFKQAFGQATDPEEEQLDRLTEKYNELNRLRQQETDQTLGQVRGQRRQEDLDRRQAELGLRSEAREGQARRLDRFGMNFAADQIRQESAIEEENLRFEQEKFDIEQRYSDNAPFRDKLLEQADAINKLNIEDIDSQFKDFGETLADVGLNGVGGFFNNWITGSESAGEAFEKFGKQILAMIAQMIIQFIALAIYRALAGAGGGAVSSSAPGSTFSGFPSTPGVVAAASGGLIRGPGTGTSDSIPALLSNGEYVVRAAAVRDYGTHLLDNLNSGRIPQVSLSDVNSRPQQREGNRTAVVNLNVSTPDTGGFNRSEHQLGKQAAESIRRAMSRI